MIAVIAGEGNLPKIIIKKFNQKKINFCIINLSKKKIIKRKNIYNLNITEISKILNLLKKNKCNEVILAGKVSRPNISEFKLDYQTVKLLPEIIFNLKKGDSYLLDFVVNLLRKNNINVVSCLKYLPEISADRFICSTKISNKEIADIKKGRILLNHINSKFDVGQSIVINNGFVVGIEAAEGTDLMLNKIVSIQKKINKGSLSGVLVKMPKKIQDIRVDIPTIGFRTIQNCLRAGIRGIALKKNENIFLDQEKSIKLIKEKNFFIKVVN